MGETIGFKVEFDAAASRVDIATPIISWNSQMEEFNEAITACVGNRRDKPYTPISEVCKEFKKVALERDVQIAGRKNFLANENERLLTLAAALDDIKDAPVETVTNKPANLHLADEMRLLVGRAHIYNWEATPGDKQDTVAQQPTTPSDKDDTVDIEPEKPADTSAVSEEDLRAWELEMVDAVNKERRRAGVPELEIKEEAIEYARYWAEYLKTKFRHSEYLDTMTTHTPSIAA